MELMCLSRGGHALLASPDLVSLSVHHLVTIREVCLWKTPEAQTGVLAQVGWGGKEAVASMLAPCWA